MKSFLQIKYCFSLLQLFVVKTLVPHFAVDAVYNYFTDICVKYLFNLNFCFVNCLSYIYLNLGITFLPLNVADAQLYFTPGQNCFENSALTGL